MQIAQTDRTTVRRQSQRASYERELVDAVIDEALSCHVGFAVEGRPWVIPTIHARVDDVLYLHGAVANHMLRSLTGGLEACVTITLVDGLVLARSAFHHSMNYRSVMIFGRLTTVDDDAEKQSALHALVEHVKPGLRRMPSCARPWGCGCRSTRRRPRCARAGRSTTPRISRSRSGPVSSRWCARTVRRSPKPTPSRGCPRT